MFIQPTLFFSMKSENLSIGQNKAAIQKPKEIKKRTSEDVLLSELILSLGGDLLLFEWVGEKQ
ncbi:hypothetical protein DWY25_16160 [Holdemania filiformis]|uniref:Uncharacterized protein n=1 Tax=Holdemania filiformis TaxID=61171 RepID=A0A412FJD3_9FIRM|nr:hypothetical protein DWY25_16160 [Holdemania filiformis]